MPEKNIRQLDHAYANFRELFDRHFTSLEQAKAVEALALSGDDRAQVQLWKLYQDATYKRQEGFAPEGSYGIRRVDLKRSAVVHPVAAGYVKAMAENAGNVEAVDFPTSVALGNRQHIANYAVWRDGINLTYSYGIKVPEIIPAPHQRYIADEWNHIIKNGYQPNGKAPIFYSNDFYKRIHDVRQNTSAASQHFFGFSKPVEYAHFIQNRFERVLPLLEICARAGSADAATELGHIHNLLEWQAEGGWSIKKIQNPFYSLGKADYWNKASAFLAGKGEDALLDSFILSQDQTSEGLYNIAVALYDNSHVRAAYNKRLGKEPDDYSSADDFMRHAANLGSANAAWRYADIWHNAADRANDPINMKKAYSWYAIAAELGHPNARHRLDYLSKQDKALALSGSGHREPSEAHLQRYPHARASIHVNPVDYSFLFDESQGDIRTRIRRGKELSDKQVAEFGAIVQSLEEKIAAMLREAGQKADRVEAIDQARAIGFENNTKLQKSIGEREADIDSSQNKATGQIVAHIATAITIGMVADSHFNPGRAVSYAVGSAFDIESLNRKKANLTAQLTDIGLLDEQQAELIKEVERISQLRSIVALQKDEAATSRLIQGYLRQQVLELADQNCEYAEKYARQAGINSVDGLLAAFEREGETSADKKRIFESIRNFCLGVADSNDLHIMLACSDAMDPGLHHAALHRFVERHVKPNIDEYIPKSSRIDVLKTAQFKLAGLSGGERAASIDTPVNADNNANLAGLLQSDFATEGSSEINRIFTFYLHRHGNKVLQATRLNDGIPADSPQDKKVVSWTKAEKEEFVERTIDFYKHSSDALPAVESIFLRACAAEYFEPQNVATSGRRGSFKDNPQAPVAYPMISDVVNEFVRRMSLSPITSYREAMKDKAALDGLIAQSFIDFFAVVGQAHVTQFKRERDALAIAYSTKNYGPRFRDCCNTITDDAEARYDLFQSIFAQNLQKTLEISTLDDSKELLDQLQKIKDMGVQALEPEHIILPGTPQSLERSLRRNRRFENMHPPFMGGGAGR